MTEQHTKTYVCDGTDATELSVPNHTDMLDSGWIEIYLEDSGLYERKHFCTVACLVEYFGGTLT